MTGPLIFIPESRIEAATSFKFGKFSSGHRSLDRKRWISGCEGSSGSGDVILQDSSSELPPPGLWRYPGTTFCNYQEASTMHQEWWRGAWVDVSAFCTFLSGLHPQIYLVDSITRNRLNRRYQAAGVVYLDNSRVKLEGYPRCVLVLTCRGSSL
jgi:hypothetical protein